jgi:hypothetical protein
MAARTIRIIAGAVTARASLNQGATAAKIWAALPLEARASRWGEEIYFDIGLDCPPESPREVVEMGDLAFWPPGHAFCIFFGPTPASRGTEIRAASAVNVVGRVIGDATVFRQVRAGTRVTIKRDEPAGRSR